MFCDELKLIVIAGKGGNGCVSFRREKFVQKGGPDGGDGGHGGDVIFKVNSNVNTLAHLAGKKIFKAEIGDYGKSKKMHGKNGQDLILEVPIGTIIFNADKSQCLADLSHENDVIHLALGGKGGLGNSHFATSVHQTPRFAEQGEHGEEKEINLELKLVADVGLIGLPSVGKSTLISVISNARPKIAAYHFTTLIPNLGMVNMEKHGGSPYDNFIVADIPGLIEGASEGKGLGIKFLKHISRTKLLIHLIDASLEDIEKNYKAICEEIKKFDKNLIKREKIIVINKVDLIDDEKLKDFTKRLKKIVKTKKIIPISAQTHEGIKTLLFEITKELLKIKNAGIKKKKTIREIPIIKPTFDRIRFQLDKIKKEGSIKHFYISGKKIDQIAVMTDINNIEGLERMYNFIDKFGIKKEIDRKGAYYGDLIIIKNKKIPYRP